MFTRKTLILAKKETTYGVDPTPTATANAIEAKNVTLTPLAGDFIDRDLLRPWFGNSGRVAGAKYCTLAFETELAGSGAAGTAPPWGVLLKGCGMSEVITAATRVDYNTVSEGMESIMLYVYIDGTIHKLAGARGTCALNFESGGLPTLQFTFTALFAAPVAGAFPASPVFSAWKRPLPIDKANTAMAYFGQNINGRSLSFDLGNEVQYRNLFNQEDVLISNRNITGKTSFELPPLATYNWIGAALAGTSGTLSLSHGLTAGNKVQISANAMQVTNPAYSDHLGVRFLDVDLQFVPVSGNDDLTISAL